MDPRAEKLAKQGIDRDLAAQLVAAGFDTPRKIKEATVGQLTEMDGVGPVTAGKIKATLKREQ